MLKLSIKNIFYTFLNWLYKCRIELGLAITYIIVSCVLFKVIQFNSTLDVVEIFGLSFLIFWIVFILVCILIFEIFDYLLYKPIKLAKENKLVSLDKNINFKLANKNNNNKNLVINTDFNKSDINEVYLSIKFSIEAFNSRSPEAMIITPEIENIYKIEFEHLLTSIRTRITELRKIRN
jgi:hypothetical protein